MISYTQVNLTDLLNAYNGDEDRVKAILFDFHSPYNKDIEEFLKSKAIEFSKRGLSATHLVFTEVKTNIVLVGYYALASKYINTTTKGRMMTSKMRSRINRFARYDAELKSYIMPVPLIGQLGKNYNNEYNKLITGDELLKMACDKVKNVQLQVGGKMVYLECENNRKIIDFYEKNGFVNFGERKLEYDETGLSGEYLVQMLKCL